MARRYRDRSNALADKVRVLFAEGLIVTQIALTFGIFGGRTVSGSSECPHLFDQYSQRST